MDKNIEILAQSSLFNGVDIKDIEDGLFYLNPVTKKYKKGEVIILSGTKVTDVGIVISGKVQIVKEDIRGNRSIIAEVGHSGIFAQALACARVQHSPVSVIAQGACEIIFINFDKIVNAHGSKITGKLIKNMMTLIAQKNILLNNKLEHISKRSIREKLLSYFNELALKAGSRKFALPFSKTSLADYLFIDRSAMSRELSAMQADGIIKFKDNNFELE
ncbi:CRP-like cAMP-binding protein [Elusimicrobium posterum]|uniref:Crp/Fnr family transcriptional regulator n=1 Tax=Elusimicrobium posterum TaxID=3116653 RepID=UPI003C7944E6